MDIIKDSFEYYDKNIDFYDNIIKQIKHIELNPKEGKCKVFDKNNIEIYSSTFEFLGKYDAANQIWIWSWAIPYFSKKITNISRKIIKYALDIEMPSRLYLKTELTTSRFKISNELQLDIHKAIASYISKQPFIFLATPHENLLHISKDLTVGEHFLIILTDYNKYKNGNENNKKTENND